MMAFNESTTTIAAAMAQFAAVSSTDLEYGLTNYSSDDDSNFSSSYNGQEVYPPLISHTVFYTEYIIPVVFALIFVVGLVGNGALIYIIVGNKNLRNTPNIFIVSLAIGDLLLLLVAVPFSATVFTFSYWPYGTVMCKVNEFMQTLSLGVSVFTLVSLSGDRYMAIVYPMSRHKGSPTLRTALIAGGIWVLAGALALMDLVQTQLVNIHGENNTVMPICLVQSNDTEDAYARFRTIFRLVVYLALPVLVICVFYVLMARILVLSSRNMPGDSKNCSQAARQLKARKKVAKVVLSFVVVFMLCWFPYHMYRVWFYFLPGDFNMFWLVFKFASFCLAFINSCLNPFALYFLSKQFHGYYNRYLFCCCNKNDPEQNGEYVTTLYRFNRKSGRTQNSISITTSHTLI